VKPSDQKGDIAISVSAVLQDGETLEDNVVLTAVAPNLTVDSDNTSAGLPESAPNATGPGFLRRSNCTKIRWKIRLTCQGRLSL